MAQVWRGVKWPWFAVVAAVVIANYIMILQVVAQAKVLNPKTALDPFPTTYADPAVPLMQLPGKFHSRRSTANISAEAGKRVEVINVKGAGCVRHLWFVFGEKNLDDLEIEILVDDATEPQVRMPFRSFFGALLGFEDYHINSAGVVNFPNFTVKNDPLIPPKASPGWNIYLPIPFSSRCRISLYSKSPKNGAAMVDWQQYGEDVELTPLRFHAQRTIAQPASPGKPFPIAEAQGTGFLAGYIMGWRQKDHRDMVFHNSGTRMLIDGQTDPHVICGHNVEDDFGFSWGFNDYQTRWTGCPYRHNRGRNDQDGVFYRFFGPDPILFRSSLIFTSNARDDDYEAVSYFYKTKNSNVTRGYHPKKWNVIGPFADGSSFDVFKQPADDLVRQLSQPDLPAKISVGVKDYAVSEMDSTFGWLRLEHIVQHRPAYPLTDHSFYARTTLISDTERKATLRLGFDNWAIVYLNGKKVATVDHTEEFETAKIAISLQKGNNELLIKTNNRMNRDRHIWVLNCAVE